MNIGVRIIRLPRSMIVGFLQGDVFVRDLPRDVFVTHVFMRPENPNVVNVMVVSREFSSVPDGEDVPVLDVHFGWGKDRE